MEVEVHHLLPTRCTNMELELVSSNAMCVCELLCFINQHAWNVCSIFSEILHRRDKVLGDKEEVCFHPWPNVPKSQYLTIFIHDVRWNLSIPNLMKDSAFLHTS